MIQNMRLFHLPFAILALIYLLSCPASCKVGVHIISGVPNDKPTPLQVRCQSKDDDIGFHTLYQSQELTWRFNPNFITTTLYWCHFYWGAKQRSFAVYDNKISYRCPSIFCEYYWVARPTGFKLSLNKKNWEKMNDWQ